MPEEALFLLTKEYSLILAVTQEDFQAVKKLRKAIISHNYPELQKTKEYQEYIFNKDDKQSFIYLLQHNSTQEYVGTVRIFFINKKTTVKTTLMQKEFHIQNIDHITQDLPFCEISRFALSNKHISYAKFSKLKLRTYLSLALMIATRINAFLYQYSTVFSIMEPSLHRILKRQHANFEQISDPVDHYGIRIPYAINRKKLLQETEENVGNVTRYYLKQLCQNPDSFWQFIDNNPYLERSDIQLNRICQLFKEYGDDVDLALLLGDKESII